MSRQLKNIVSLKLFRKIKSNISPLSIYICFLQREIPNIIQITTLPTALTSLYILTRGEYSTLSISLTSWITSTLLGLYLIESLKKCLIQQLIDPLSEINRAKLDFDKTVNKIYIYHYYSDIKCNLNTTVR